jgi:hypothetical protein
MSNFTVKDVSMLNSDQSWRKDEWIKDRHKLLTLAVQSIKMDLEYEFSAFAVVIKLIKEEEYIQTYVNSPDSSDLVRLTFDVKYKFREYTGETYGNILVHKRIIQKEALDKSPDSFSREIDNGFQFVKTFIPRAIHRVGCYCCYGDGPNLEQESKKLKNGDTEISFYVDFNFNVEDYTHGN